MNFARRLALLSCWFLLFWQISGRAVEPVLTPRPALEPAEPAKPLIAWWRFDEADAQPCADASGNSNDASQEGGANSGLNHVEGLFGSALRFSGQHLLRVLQRILLAAAAA